MELTDVQRQLAEQLLLTVINREMNVEYNELAERIKPPIFHRQVGREIGEVSKLCHELGLPLLSAKVVSKGSGRAREGFFNLMSELGIDTKGVSEKELFREELKKIRECKEWYKLVDFLELDLDLPRPGYDNDNDANLENGVGTSYNSSWIIPSNIATYDVVSAFQELDVIDWRQSVNYRIGDIVYIYCAKPYQRIMFQAQVLKLNIPFEDTIEDKEFWTNFVAERDLAKQRTYSRLKLIQAVDDDRLSLERLQEHGLKVAPQSPMRISGQLEEYVKTGFEEGQPLRKTVIELPPFPEELDEAQSQTFIEGAKKKIVVNAYERNPVARRKCIEIHGSKCLVCGFDFGSFYGEHFEGKIHVHHLKLLHSINSSYQIDPEHDLIPVCPNCHMVLHSKQGGIYSVEEVKEMIAKPENCQET